MKNPKFVLSKTKKGQFHFVLLAKNGKVICQSETYKTRRAALNAIERIRECAPKSHVKENWL